MLLYEGKMVQMYDYRAASLELNPQNVHRPTQPVPATKEEHEDPDWLHEPQYWVAAAEVEGPCAIGSDASSPKKSTSEKPGSWRGERASSMAARMVVFVESPGPMRHVSFSFGCHVRDLTPRNFLIST